MRKILTSLSALALSAGMATAGGMVAPTEPIVAAPAPLATYDWTGGYAGLGLTYGRASYKSGLSGFLDAELPEDTGAGFFWPSGSGWGIGGFAGFNWQNDNIVYGVEAHLSGHRMRGTRRITAVEGGNDIEDEEVIGRIRTDVRSLASLRGRVGVAQDRTLFFVTAGPAIGNVRHTATIDEGPFEGSYSQSRSVGGLVVGVGIEHALANGWHIRGDLEHYRFGKRNFNTLGLPEGPDFPNVRTRVNLARISAVFRF